MTLIQGYFGIIELCHSDRYDLFLVDMEQRCLEEIGILLRYNHNHDPHTGRFTSGSGVDNGKKDVDKLTESSIINYAKATDVFEVSNNSENSNFELQNVVDLMENQVLAEMLWLNYQKKVLNRSSIIPKYVILTEECNKEIPSGCMLVILRMKEWLHRR